MKKLLFLMIIIVAMISCESKSGQRHRDAQGVLNNSNTIAVIVVDTYPEKVMLPTGIEMFKTKVRKADSSVCFILTINQFDNNDILVIKPEQILKN
jgi:uncharacterized protein YcfL